MTLFFKIIKGWNMKLHFMDSAGLGQGAAGPSLSGWCGRDQLPHTLDLQPGHLGSSAGLLTGGGTSCSQPQPSAPAHPAGPSWSSHSTRAGSPAAVKNGQKWGTVNGSTFFALIHIKRFSLHFEKAPYIWSHHMRGKICHFQLCHFMLCRKAQTLTEPQPSIECICILCLQPRLFLPCSDRIREEFSVTN